MNKRKNRLMSETSRWDFGSNLLVCGAEKEGDDDDNGAGGTDDDDAKLDDAMKRILAKNEELLGEVKELKRKQREAEAAEAERKAKEQELEDEKARKAKDWDKLEEGYKKQLAAKDEEAAKWKNRYQQKLIDLELGGALDEVKVKPEMKKVVAAFLQKADEFELDDEGVVTVGGKALKDYVKAWAETDEGKAFVVHGNSGGDANGGGKGKGGDAGHNPFMPGEHFSLTKQGELYKSDPAKARELAKAAGVTLG